MATTMTLTMEQLQNLLQAQTFQLEQHFTRQMASLQANLENMVEEKLQAKFDEAEDNVKQFMKESIDDDDPEETEIIVESTKKATEDLAFLKDHVLQMEQSVSRIVELGDLAVPEDEEMDVSIPSPVGGTFGGDSPSNPPPPGGATMMGGGSKLLPLLPSPKLARPPMIQRSSSAGSSVMSPANTGLMEKMVFDCCLRLEEIVEKKTSAFGRSNPRRTRSVDGSDPGATGGGGAGSVSALRAMQQHMDDLMERRMGNLEQFIDTRHAELEAVYGSSYDNLKKLIVETVRGSKAGGGASMGSGGGNASNHSSSSSLGAASGGGFGGGGGSSHHYGGGAGGGGGNPLTREELEAVLDARLDAELAESGKPLTRDELEEILDERISAEEAEAKPLTREELEAVLDARIAAEEEQERRRSKALTRSELEAVLDARIAEEEEEEARQQQEQQARGSETQEPAESSNSMGNKSLHMAMERLIQQQQQWIEMQSSTRDLEQQVQFKLDQLEGDSGATGADQASIQRVESKLESLEKLVLAAIANSAKKKQRSSSKKPSKKLSQIMRTSSSQDNNNNDNRNNNASDAASTARATDDSSNVNIGTSSHLTPRVSNAYADVSVDDKGLEEEEEKDKEPSEEEGDHVKSFMNTLSKFKELNKKQEDVRDHRMDTSDDVDEGDDDIDSNASMSVDSSVAGGRAGAGGGAGDDDNKVMRTLQRLESKLDQLDEKLPETGHSPVITVADGINRERSTNARHSREVVVNTDSIEASIRAEHSKLKQWIIEQQDEMNNSGRNSESGLQGLGGGGSAGGGDPFNTARAMPDSPGSRSTIDPKQLQSVQEKLNAIEALVSTNQSFLQEQRRLSVPPVPKELPLVQPLGGTGTIDLERKILSHLDTMDKSVQFKLDEIFAEVQSKTAQQRRDSDWSTMSEPDQTAIVKVVETHLRELQEAITTHLKENIPDYGMAKSVLAENLEDMRQIVSEVAISEVELLKTQLGVAEEAEQEALHAVLVMREQLEESKEAERRALYMPRAAPQQKPTEDTSGGLWNFGPFGQLLGQQLRPPSNAAMQNRFQNRNMSIGQQSHASGLSHHSASRGLNYNSSASGFSRNRSPKQKLEDWKNQISDLDDKATDLRTFYSQLRGQGPDEWLEQRSQTRGTTTPVKSSLKTTKVRSESESKEMEPEIRVDPFPEPIPPLTPIPAEDNNGEGGDWI